MTVAAERVGLEAQNELTRLRVAVLVADQAIDEFRDRGGCNSRRERDDGWRRCGHTGYVSLRRESFGSFGVVDADRFITYAFRRDAPPAIEAGIGGLRRRQ